MTTEGQEQLWHDYAAWGQSLEVTLVAFDRKDQRVLLLEDSPEMGLEATRKTGPEVKYGHSLGKCLWRWHWLCFREVQIMPLSAEKSELERETVGRYVAVMEYRSSFGKEFGSSICCFY